MFRASLEPDTATVTLMNIVIQRSKLFHTALVQHYSEIGLSILILLLIIVHVQVLTSMTLKLFRRKSGMPE